MLLPHSVDSLEQTNSICVRLTERTHPESTEMHTDLTVYMQ